MENMYTDKLVFVNTDRLQNRAAKMYGNQKPMSGLLSDFLSDDQLPARERGFAQHDK